MASFNPLSGMGFMPPLPVYGGMNPNQTFNGGSPLNPPLPFDSFTLNPGNSFSGGYNASAGFEGVFGVLQSILQFVSGLMLPNEGYGQDNLPLEPNGQDSAYPNSEKPLSEAKGYAAVPDEEPAPLAPSDYKEAGGKQEAGGKSEPCSEPESGGKPGKAEKPETPTYGQQPADDKASGGQPEAGDKPEPYGKPEAGDKPEAYGKPEAGGKPEPGGKPGQAENPETPTYGHGQKPAGGGRKAPVQGGGPNETVLKNNGKESMKVAFMKNPTPENPDSKPEIVEIQAGETLQAGLPEDWKGRIYKVNDSGAQEATLGEVNFERGKTWYDVSAIDGFNGGMTIEPTGGAGRGTGNDRAAGSSKDIRKDAPPELLKDGGDVLASTDPVGDYGSNKGAVDYLRQSYGGTGDVYTNPIDDREKDSPMRDTTDTSLTINLY